MWMRICVRFCVCVCVCVFERVFKTKKSEKEKENDKRTSNQIILFKCNFNSSMHALQCIASKVIVVLLSLRSEWPWNVYWISVDFVSYQTIHADNNFRIAYDTFDNFIDFLNFVIDNIHSDNGSIDFCREPPLTANLLLFVNGQNFKNCSVEHTQHCLARSYTNTRMYALHTYTHARTHSPDSEANGTVSNEIRNVLNHMRMCLKLPRLVLCPNSTQMRSLYQLCKIMKQIKISDVLCHREHNNDYKHAHIQRIHTSEHDVWQQPHCS